MKWNFSELLKYKQAPMEFNEELDLLGMSQELFGDVILNLEPVQVNGWAQMERDDVILHAHVTGELTTPSTRSARPVKFPLDFMIDEVYIRDTEHADRYEIEESVILIEDDVINFSEVLVQYIFLQIPLQVLADGEEQEAMPTGDGWEVISEDDYLIEQAKGEETATNTPLAGLADLMADEHEK
ncbi:DUF177 domain-containing protein [Weissella coleopterorum]|uniref:DUF177 domain-containing protein n=2 Tax=Weissella coleopterorum TaxID=2714949 RepID=A0A6G8B221_9LACO|nr:DUF177 domain-containing protein [Weissella coleopterorum]